MGWISRGTGQKNPGLRDAMMEADTGHGIALHY